jgi:hypothetical protein
MLVLWIVACAVVLTVVFVTVKKLRRFEKDVGMDEWGDGMPESEDERRSRQVGIGLTSGGSSGSATH